MSAAKTSPMGSQPHGAPEILLVRNVFDDLLREYCFLIATRFETARFSRSGTSPRACLHEVRRFVQPCVRGCRLQIGSFRRWLRLWLLPSERNPSRCEP